MFALRAACLLTFCCLQSIAETGRDAWLRYSPQDVTREYTEAFFPIAITSFDSTLLATTARDEVIRGVRGMFGRTLRIESGVPREDAIVLGTPAGFSQTPQWRPAVALPEDSYSLKTVRGNGRRYIIISAPNDRGLLYGAFALMRKLQRGEPIAALDEQQTPYAPIRWVNQWDNLDGSIERGYGGRSIFWEGGHARADLSRVSEYGRLLASIGINGCSIDNVNADKRVLSSDFLPDVARIAAALRPWGVKVVLAVDFASPQSNGKLDTFDPLNDRVAEWWKTKADEVYTAVPDLAGFLIKADSEGRAGPSLYHRTHADAANVVARALAPHHGLLFYRGFVYDHHMDWRDPKNDRARAAYDNFHALDGQFADNAVLQVKNGPIDFQVREPVSPLIGSLEKTNQVMELQVTQEYMGQARHMVYLAPQWKEVLDFDMGPGTAKALSAGKTFHRALGGFVGVANVGLDDNWLGNHLSQANLYAFGRLAWNPDLSAREIADDWTRMTFGADPQVIRTVTAMQLSSWRTYENYTGPLGLQTLTDITGNHYGVRVEASENNSWGQWHRADNTGVGMDRSVATGTGYAGQYSPAVAKRYENVATTPDDLVLFFHHVPYTHVLRSGKTVIQTLYDFHYAGAQAVESYVEQWKALSRNVDEQRYHAVLSQLEYQAGQAELWRDAVCNYFAKLSGIADDKKRVGNHPGRYEAEAMQLDGYTAMDVTPWEAASGGKAVECGVAKCAATFAYDGPAGWSSLRVRYFDQNSGTASYRVFVGEQLIDEWIADAHLPTAKVDATSSMLRIISGVALRPGDRIRVEGTPAGPDKAALDYVEIVSAR